jgi:hypothetical protein
MEAAFGTDFAQVRIHEGPQAEAVGALAYTQGTDIHFAAGQYQPGSQRGQELLGHELTHVVQQSQGRVQATTQASGVDINADASLEREADELGARAARRDEVTHAIRHRQGGSAAHEVAPTIQRQAEATPAQPATTPAPDDPLTAPLTDSEWRGIDIWLSRGEVGIDPLTDDAEHNAALIAAALFNERRLSVRSSGGEDPLLGVLTEVTIADPRVQALKRHVVSRGPIIHWPAVPTTNRLVYAMERLIDTHRYPVNGAAGIVGNLLAESGVLPSRIEGSAAATPMRATNFAGQRTDFSPDEVRDRNRSASVGPQSPGVGLAQWTTRDRRAGLFQRTAADGRELGSSVLFNMDAQIGYLVSELQAATGLNASLTAGGVSVNTASDNVVYQFEIPGSILDGSGGKLPRTDPAVQSVFATRRNNANEALAAYQAAHP